MTLVTPGRRAGEPAPPGGDGTQRQPRA